MNAFKKSSYITRVEDKYVFRVSTIFWHLLIGLITITAVIAIAVLIWSLIPTSKEKVNASTYPTKPEYPPVEKVNLADFGTYDMKPVTFQSDAPPPINHQSTEPTEYDPDRPAYNLSLSELKRIIPKEKWQPGYYTYPYGELAWQVNLTENYRIWNSYGQDVEQQLEKSYNKIKAIKFKDKKYALDSYLKILRHVPQDNSSELLTFILNEINHNPIDIVLLDSTITLIASSMNSFPGSLDATKYLIGFALAYPTQAFDFIPFAVSTCVKFPESERYQMLTVLRYAYINSFNYNIEVQNEATAQFHELLPSLHTSEPAMSLRKFYSIYSKKNKLRNDKIIQIEEEYNSQVAAILADSAMKERNAEMNLRASRAVKSEFRNKAVYAIGGGFVAIALLGTILTLLSIQRILKRLELLSNQKTDESKA